MKERMSRREDFLDVWKFNPENEAMKVLRETPSFAKFLDENPDWERQLKDRVSELTRQKKTQEEVMEDLTRLMFKLGAVEVIKGEKLDQAA